MHRITHEYYSKYLHTHKHYTDIHLNKFNKRNEISKFEYCIKIEACKEEKITLVGKKK